MRLVSLLLTLAGDDGDDDDDDDDDDDGSVDAVGTVKELKGQAQRVRAQQDPSNRHAPGIPRVLCDQQPG